MEKHVFLPKSGALTLIRQLRLICIVNKDMQIRTQAESLVLVRLDPNRRIWKHVSG